MESTRRARSSNTLIEGNAIGTDLTGVLNLGNGKNGVDLASSSNTIGGTIAGAANAIDYNGAGQSGSGVQLVGVPTDDEILSNSIFGNAILGINLGYGPTPNHQPGTTGPNNYQNYPVLSAAASDGTATYIQGTLTSLPDTNFLVQFFCSPSESFSGFGQGKTLIGTFNALTNASGLATFLYTVPTGTTPGQYISATATDPSGNTSEFALDQPIQGQINLVLSGTASPSPVGVGGQVTYVLTVNNQGNTPADNVSLTNQLPAGVTLVSAHVSQGYVQPITGTSEVGELGTIPAGGTATMTVIAQTNANTPLGTIVDNANVTSSEPDPTPGDESVAVSDKVVTTADVSVQLTADHSSILAGSNLTYTIKTTNNGPQTAKNVSVILPIMAGEAFVSANSPLASYSAGQVTVNLGSLVAGASSSVQVVVEGLAAGTLNETATAASDSVDPNLLNNTSTVSTQVNPAADLQVSIASSETPIVLGGDFDYVVTLTNAGPSDSSNVVLTDTLPVAVQFVSATSDQDVAPAYSGGVVTLSLPTLAVGATATLTIEVLPQAAPGSSVTDLASATETDADPDPADSSAKLITPVQGVSDLGITASSLVTSPYVGQGVPFVLNITNQGPNDEPDAVVSWPIPGDASFVSASCPEGSGSSIAQGIVSIDVGPVEQGQSVSATLVLMPLASAAGQFSTTFSVQGENIDPVSSNDSASATVQVTPAADLAVAINPGQFGTYDLADWTYTETVTNLGLSDATGVVLSSLVPANVTLISATPPSQGSPVTVQDGIATASLGVLPAGQSATVTFVAVPSSSGTIDLAASVTGDQYDPSPANNQVSLPVWASPSDNLSVSVVPQSTSVLTGHSWSFTAWVRNSGPDAATDVVMGLPLTGGLVFNSATASQGTVSLKGAQVFATLGQINSGSSASVTIVVMAPTPGLVTQSASVASSENPARPRGPFGQRQRQRAGIAGPSPVRRRKLRRHRKCRVRPARR